MSRTGGPRGSAGVPSGAGASTTRVPAVLAALVRESRPAASDAAPESLRVFASRLGELGALLGDSDPDPLAREVLEEAREGDPGGLLLRYAITMLVVPRLLVSVADARARDDDPRLARVAEVLVGSLYELAAVAPAGEPDDPAWAERARSLIRRLDDGGAAESFVADP